MQWFDSHTHVQFAAFNDDRQEVVVRALKKGVSFINIGTQKDTSRLAVELTHEYKQGVYAAVGLHPIHTHKFYHDPKELGGGKGFTSRGEPFDYEYYKQLTQDKKVVAVGECGLDYFRIKNEELGIKEKQREVFIQHITLAKEVKKPLMCHCRPSEDSEDAYNDLYGLIKQNVSDLTGFIVHFFTGSLEIAKQFLEIGSYFTFGGVITFTRDYDDVIRYIPLDRILLETDAPYVAPEPYRGKRSEPVYVIEVAKKMSELKQVSMEKLSEQILTNNERVFGVTPPSDYNVSI